MKISFLGVASTAGVLCSHLSKVMSYLCSPQAPPSFKKQTEQQLIFQSLNDLNKLPENLYDFIE